MRARHWVGAGAGALSWLARAAGLLCVGLAGLLAFALLAEAAAGPVTRTAANSVDFRLDLPEAEELRQLEERSYVYGADGVRLATLHGEINRVRVPVDELPDHVWQAVLAAEDRSFFEHEGYDVEGMSRALLTNVQAGSVEQGGSTITQQLAKAVVGDEQTLNRKLAELWQAMALEETFSKEELLEQYLNQVYLGSGAYGVGAAAEEYFATDARDLRPEQAALLAALIRAPGGLNPRTHPDGAVARRDAVLAGMVEEGWLDADEAAQLTRLPLGVVPPGSDTHREPYIVEAVRREFTCNPDAGRGDRWPTCSNEVAAVSGETQSERFERLYTGGLEITTTIDPELQDIAERLVRRHFPERDGVTASIAALDPRDGRVLAAAFGRDFDADQFNLALQGRRQPGSAFKPYVMATALEQGVDPVETELEGESGTTLGHGVLDDDPSEPWLTDGVTNFAGRSFDDPNLHEAMASSVNTAFAELILGVGVPETREMAYRLGVDEEAFVGRSGEPELPPAMALGGLPQGTTPLELASAYGTFANEGLRVQPHVIDTITDSDGESLYEADFEGDQAVDADVAEEMTSTLLNVVENGTGEEAALEGWDVAGKTGTTQENRDIWFVGYTPNLVAAVWVGHPTERVTLKDMGSSDTAAPLWREFMEEALRDEEPQRFEGVELPPDADGEDEEDDNEDDTLIADDGDEDESAFGGGDGGGDDEDVSVPALGDMTRGEAESELESLDLDAVFSDGGGDDDDPVSWQVPAPGVEVAPGESVQVGIDSQAQ